MSRRKRKPRSLWEFIKANNPNGPDMTKPINRVLAAAADVVGDDIVRSLRGDRVYIGEAIGLNAAVPQHPESCKCEACKDGAP